MEPMEVCYSCESREPRLLMWRSRGRVWGDRPVRSERDEGQARRRAALRTHLLRLTPSGCRQAASRPKVGAGLRMLPEFGL